MTGNRDLSKDELTRLSAEVERLIAENLGLIGRPSPYSKTWDELNAKEGTRIIRERIGDWFHGSHYVNVAIRRNAMDEQHEADWLKYVPGFVEKLVHESDEARAQVERWQRACERYAYDADEALSQVAVLVRALENVLYAQLGGHLNPTDDGKKVLNKIRSLPSQISCEARALLDGLDLLKRELQQAEDAEDLLRNKLQRAEAVVEAVKSFQDSQNWGPYITDVPSYSTLQKTLAAWEEGKA